MSADSDRVALILMCNFDCSGRSADDEDAFPDELKVPIGRADHMLDDAAIVPAVGVSDDPKTQEESSPQPESPDKSSALVRIFLDDGRYLLFIATGLS